MNVAAHQTASKTKAAPAKPKSVDMTMSAAELSAAIDACGTVYIAIAFEDGNGTSFLRWKDRSFAIRRKIRALAKDCQKQHPQARFKARVQDGLEKVLIIGG